MLRLNRLETIEILAHAADALVPNIAARER